VEINDIDLSYIETQLSLIGDDFYRMGEALALLYNNFGKLSKIDNA
jgi:hypothetical protein